MGSRHLWTNHVFIRRRSMEVYETEVDETRE